MRRRTFLATLFAGAVGLLATPFRRVRASAQTVARATRTWFVDASAQATGDGSEAKPFKTLSAAFEQVQPGDTIYIRAKSFTLESGTRVDVWREQ